MFKLMKHYDADGNEVDEDGRPIKREVIADKGRVHVPLVFMDARAGPPAGQYFVIDRCGRIAGLGRVDLAEKAAVARSDYAQRLVNASKKLTPLLDGEPALTGHALYVWRLQNAHRRKAA